MTAPADCRISDEAGSPFEFDRYINGKLMAEGVTIERETTVEAAARAAARIASRGPNGEAPVLVLRERRAQAVTPVAHAYVVEGECEQIEWGTEIDLPDDPALVFLYAAHPSAQAVAWGARGLSRQLAAVSLERIPGFDIPLFEGEK